MLAVRATASLLGRCMLYAIIVVIKQTSVLPFIKSLYKKSFVVFSAHLTLFSSRVRTVALEVTST